MKKNQEFLDRKQKKIVNKKMNIQIEKAYTRER